jgi:hypothetical protein
MDKFIKKVLLRQKTPSRGISTLPDQKVGPGFTREGNWNIFQPEVLSNTVPSVLGCLGTGL